MIIRKSLHTIFGVSFGDGLQMSEKSLNMYSKSQLLLIVYKSLSILKYQNLFLMASFINYVTLKSGFRDHPHPMLRTCYTALDTHPPPEGTLLFLNLEIEEQKNKKKLKKRRKNSPQRWICRPDRSLKK
jgi:hypothetical protein